MRQRHFTIFKSNHDSRYSITECGSFGVKQAYMTDGCISGDRGVLLRLSQMVPENESIESFVRKNVGHLIYDEAYVPAGKGT